MADHKIACFKCGAELPNIMEDRDGNQPSGGLEFTAPGHYGSTVFDPMDGSRLAVNICDSCLRVGRERGDVLIISARQYAEWKA